MSITEQPELRTRMFARVLGPFLVIFAESVNLNEALLRGIY